MFQGMLQTVKMSREFDKHEACFKACITLEHKNSKIGLHYKEVAMQSTVIFCNSLIVYIGLC